MVCKYEHDLQAVFDLAKKDVSFSPAAIVPDGSGSRPTAKTGNGVQKCCRSHSGRSAAVEQLQKNWITNSMSRDAAMFRS